MRELVLRKLQENLESAFHEFRLNGRLSFSLLLDLRYNSCSSCIALRLENHFLENLKTLIAEFSNTLHFHIKPVEVLEELLHPFNHYLVILPFLVELDQ
jgi:hypothetical protein